MRISRRGIGALTKAKVKGQGEGPREMSARVRIWPGLPAVRVPVMLGNAARWMSADLPVDMLGEKDQRAA